MTIDPYAEDFQAMRTSAIIGPAEFRFRGQSKERGADRAQHGHATFVDISLSRQNDLDIADLSGSQVFVGDPTADATEGTPAELVIDHSGTSEFFLEQLNGRCSGN